MSPAVCLTTFKHCTSTVYYNQLHSATALLKLQASRVLANMLQYACITAGVAHVVSECRLDMISRGASQQQKHTLELCLVPNSY